MTNEPRAVEPVPVQLTRIEGVVNLIAYQFSEVQEDIKEIRAERARDIEDARAERAKDRERILAVELAQAQSSGAVTSWRQWVPVILTAVSLIAGAFYFSAR